jgi:dTDP-4-dehydrorhamnose reductase
MKTVLILGAGGLVGQSLTALLQSCSDFRVVSLNRAECDVLDEVQLRTQLQLHNPAVVINAVGFVPVDRAEQEPESSYRLNFLAPLTIARMMRKLDPIKPVLSLLFRFRI